MTYLYSAGGYFGPKSVVFLGAAKCWTEKTIHLYYWFMEGKTMFINQMGPCFIMSVIVWKPEIFFASLYFCLCKTWLKCLKKMFVVFSFHLRFSGTVYNYSSQVFSGANQTFEAVKNVCFNG